MREYYTHVQHKDIKSNKFQSLPRKFRIGWFANSFVDRSATGTGRVAEELVKRFSKKYSDKFETFLICDQNTNIKAIAENVDFQNLHIVNLPKKKFRKFRSIRQYFAASRVFDEDLDLLHFLAPRQYPFFWHFPSRLFISTYHAAGDITAVADKFVLSRHIFNLVGKYQNKHLNKIVAVSDPAAEEINQAYGISKDKIVSIPLGTDHLWELPETERPEKEPYILIIGRWQKYKNVHRILEAIADCDTNNLLPKIVLIGKSQVPGNELVKKEIMKITKDSIKCLDYVTDIQLKSYYQHSSLVIHPSVNEGFGWPPFEAFGEGAKILIHSGTPASKYLNNQVGVTAVNLLDSKNAIYKAINDAMCPVSIDISTRRNFLKNIGCTWDSMIENYKELYLKVLENIND